MGKIIAIANQKGGVGKTTLTVHLAVWFAGQDRSVIVVDADPQANTTAWMLSNEIADESMMRVLLIGDPAARQLVPTQWAGVRILPGGLGTGEAMTALRALQRPFDTIAKALHPLGTLADYVLIDMPPSRAAGFHEALFAADYMLIPTQLERLSMQGVSMMAQTTLAIKRDYQRSPELLGIIPNMMRKQTREHVENLRELIETFQTTVWPPVPQSIRLAEAISYGSTVFDTAPTNPAAMALESVGRRVLLSIEGGDR
mgnify:CR=1 FL=1